MIVIKYIKEIFLKYIKDIQNSIFYLVVIDQSTKSQNNNFFLKLCVAISHSIFTIAKVKYGLLTKVYTIHLLYQFESNNGGSFC